MENLTPIEVLAKTTEENLRQKNAEFLAKYPTDDSQINYYTNLAMQVFDEFQIDGTFTDVGVRRNVAVWFENKRAQMELFRKHPYWNEEAKAIVFTNTEVRDINYEQARNFLGDILVYANKKLEDDGYDQFLYSIYCALGRNGDNASCITDDFMAKVQNEFKNRELSQKVERVFKNGVKITKLVRTACTQYHKHDGTIVDITTLADEHEDGDHNYQSFEKLYAKFADHLSELTIKKITLVSLHFCDFMLMSNGNSWASCHFINSNNIFHEESTSSYSGCYKQGCLSYALDEPSFLLYTLPSKYSGEEYYREPKITRMCCQYKDGILVTGKCYPNNEDGYITRYRQTLQHIISAVEDVTNSWTFSRNVDRITSLVRTERYSAHYRDYENRNQKPTISICRHIGSDPDNPMVIGHQAYCVHCGQELYSNDQRWLQCDMHRIKPVCSICGRYLEDEDEKHFIDGQVYCDDCCFYCDHHGCYEPASIDRFELEMEDGETITVCEYAKDYYQLCGRCNKWVRNYQTRTHKGIAYCDNCYQTIVKELLDGLKFKVIPQDSYDVGDYVLMANDVSECTYGASDDMMDNYPNRIAKITLAYKDKYNIDTNNDGRHWNWSANCFAGKIYAENLSDEMLGLLIEEVM